MLWQGGRASRDLGFPHGFSVHWCLAHVGILFFPQVGLKVLFQKCLGDKKLFGVVLAKFHVLLTLPGRQSGVAVLQDYNCAGPF